MRFNNTEAYTLHQNSADFRIPYSVTQETQPEVSAVRQVLDEIRTNDFHPSSPILDNPIFDAAVHFRVIGLTEEQILQPVKEKHTIDENNLTSEKEKALTQFRSDARRLIENVKKFEDAFRNEFEDSALKDRTKPCTFELVKKLRKFLFDRVPEFIPAWDCQPYTQYSEETQCQNFRNKILPHIDCDVIYINEYATAWNEKVEAQDLPESEKVKLRLDANFLMCKALIHDLGRWFTQDSRAHEEIPAGIAVNTGLHSDFLTLEDGLPGTHPREFNLDKPLNLETIQLMFEFFSDFFSKPHEDNIWPETLTLLQTDPENSEFAESMRTAAEWERLRQAELRHPNLGIYYMWYASNGYKKVDVSLQHHWQPAFIEKFKDRLEKQKYYLTEGRMLEIGRVFMEAIGISPAVIRERVIAKRPEFFN